MRAPVAWLLAVHRTNAGTGEALRKGNGTAMLPEEQRQSRAME